jgi:hypothetical protein
MELCEAIATADREDSNRYGARPLFHGLAGDSMPPRLAGFRVTAITCLGELNYVPGYHTPQDTPEHIDPAALDRAHGFALELVRALDRDVGRTGPPAR